MLGVADVTYVHGHHTLAVMDTTISGMPPAFAELTHEKMMANGERSAGRAKGTLGANEIGIDNFSFTPPLLKVRRRSWWSEGGAAGRGGGQHDPRLVAWPATLQRRRSRSHRRVNPDRMVSQADQLLHG